MKIINNGIAREIDILKHFKIANDEYILYKNNNSISIGLISDGKIVAPTPDKLDVLMKVLSNIISPTPVESINLANGCTMLSEIMEGSLEEVSFQNVNIPEAQLNALLPQTTIVSNNSVDSPSNVEKPKKEQTSDNRMKIYGIIIVVLIFVLLFVLFKNKIFKKGGNTPNTTSTLQATLTLN